MCCVKKDPDRCKKAIIDAFGWNMIVWVPFAFLQMLEALGIELFHTSFAVPWAITPLEVLSAQCVCFLGCLNPLFGRDPLRTWIEKLSFGKSKKGSGK